MTSRSMRGSGCWDMVSHLHGQPLIECKEVTWQENLTLGVTGLDGASSIVTRARSQAMFRSLPATQDQGGGLLV